MAANILVVEDQRAVAGALRMRLRGLGYGVLDIAKDADEAIEKAATLKPDLILMDVRLGDGMDGIEAAQRIRTEFDIPVVYVTAYADRELLDRARATQPAGFINKPFTTKDLLTAINLALDQATPAPRTAAGLREAVLTADREGRISFLNAAAERLTGWTRRDVVGHSLAAAVSTLYQLPPFTAERLIERVLASGREEALPLAGGTEPDLLAPIDDAGGRRYGVALHFGAATLAHGAANAQRVLDACRHVLEQIAFGVVLLEADARIVHMNAYARALVDEGAVFTVRDGVLCATHAVEQQILDELLAHARGGDEADAGEFALLDGGGGATRVATIATGGHGSTLGRAPLLTLRLFDLAHRRTLSATVLRQIYGLTRAEVNLVQTLVGGCSLEDGARELGIALNTARTHLKHIFNKTGAKRQSELIHQIETGPASMPVKLRERD